MTGYGLRLQVGSYPTHLMNELKTQGQFCKLALFKEIAWNVDDVTQWMVSENVLMYRWGLCSLPPPIGSLPLTRRPSPNSLSLLTVIGEHRKHSLIITKTLHTVFVTKHAQNEQWQFAATQKHFVILVLNVFYVCWCWVTNTDLHLVEKYDFINTERWWWHIPAKHTVIT